MSNCPKCGAAITEHIGGSSRVLSCSKCDWSIATTWTEPINEDETVYHLNLNVDPRPSKESLSAVSKIAGCNFIEAKKQFGDPAKVLVSCLAPEMKGHARRLDAAGVGYTIEPAFPY